MKTLTMLRNRILTSPARNDLKLHFLCKHGKSTQGMPISPRALLVQLYNEVVQHKVPTGTFANEDDFFEKLR